MIYEHIVEGNKKFYTFKGEPGYQDNENIQNYTNDPRWSALKAKIDAGDVTITPYSENPEYLDSCKKKKLAELKFKCLSVESKDITYNTNTFKCHKDFREDILSLVVESILDNGGWSETIPTASGSMITMIDSDIQLLGKAMKAQVKAARDNARNHKIAISALTTVSEVESYDINTGW